MHNTIHHDRLEARLRAALQATPTPRCLRFMSRDFGRGFPDWPSGQFDGVVSGLSLQYAESFADNPYPFHEQLRETAAVVWLAKYGIYGMARHAQVQAALNDWQTFISGAGAGIQDLRKTNAWRPRVFPGPLRLRGGREW